MTCPTTNLEVKLTGKIPWMCAIVLLVLKRGSKVLGCVGNSNGEVSGVEIWEFTTWTSKFFGVGKKPVFFPHWFQQGDHKSHGVEVQGWILSIFTSDCQKGKDISLLPTTKIVGKQNGVVVYWWLGRLNSKRPFEWIPIAVQYGWGMSRISSAWRCWNRQRRVFIISFFIWAFNLLWVPKFWWLIHVA